MKKPALIALALALLLTLGVLGWSLHSYYSYFRMPTGASIPALFTASIPAECRQVVLVLSPSQAAVDGKLWLLERQGTGSGVKWRVVNGPLTITLGHKGLAWGKGEHTAPAPVGFPIKKEGDKCSPAGVFRIPMAFGMETAQEVTPWLKLPYTPLTASIIGVDDPKSRYYNQIVDSTRVGRDWDSNEAMMRHGRAYHWGAFIAHNPEHVPEAGSCIFMHIWGGPGSGTSGCTAMSREDLKTVLAWLDPAKEPRLVQGVSGW